MDETILVEVFLPAVQQYYALVLPCAFTIKQIKEELYPMLEECTQGAVTFHEDSVFYLQKKGNLSDEQTVMEIGIQNADEIIIW